jgi:hypothetical protein
MSPKIVVTIRYCRVPHAKWPSASVIFGRVHRDRREPLACAACFDGEEQQQRQQEHDVGRQTGDTAEQRAEHRRELAKVQGSGRLLSLLRADAPRRNCDVAPLTSPSAADTYLGSSVAGRARR